MGTAIRHGFVLFLGILGSGLSIGATRTQAFDWADQTLYAAVGAQSLLGQVLRDALPPGSAAREVATQWLRTAAGQLATYGAKGDAAFRGMVPGLVAEQLVTLHVAGRATIQGQSPPIPTAQFRDMAI
jgi:hypothetical protein